MTFDEACKAAEEGKPIRHPGMSRGWTVRHFPMPAADPRKRDLFCINPHTGSNYTFIPSAEELARKDWKTVEPKERK